jgi:hypothetical protein
MSGAISRIVTPGLAVGQAPRGRLPATVPLVFPDKAANEVLVYGVDFSLLAQSSADVSIGAVSVQVQPDALGGVTAGGIAFAGLVVTFTLSDGLPDTNYLVSAIATMPSSQVLQADVQIYVLPAATPATN